MAVGSQQTVEGWSDQGKRWQCGELGQPSPAGNPGQDASPGCKAFVERTIVIPDPHRSLVGLQRRREFVFGLATEVDESDVPHRIAKFAPRHRPLTQAAVAVHPDYEGLIFFGLGCQKPASTCTNPGFLIDIP